MISIKKQDFQINSPELISVFMLNLYLVLKIFYRISCTLALKLHFLKKLLTSIFLLVFFIVNTQSQSRYPQDYFRVPLDVPMILAGTFGELRSAHFHSGMDLKTQQKEGLRVYAAAAGYVSRIKISNWGYGKAIYITHPNGYTTVYAHLKKYNKKIEQYIREYQYKVEKEEVQLFPKKGTLTIEKDEVIAFSGSTGGFIAPHLHFEIRDTKTEKIINPMHFGLIPSDTKDPIINHLRAYTFNDSSHVNTSNIELPIAFKQISSGVYKADKIEAYGKIGFAINTYDQQDGALNKNGIYKLEMFVNGTKKFQHQVETFSFDESKYVNLLIDYPFYANHKRKYQKTYIESGNKLSTYAPIKGKGYLTIKDSLNYKVVIKATDFVGNSSTLTIPITGKKSTPKILKKQYKTPYYVVKHQPKKIRLQDVLLEFPANTFYENQYLDISVNDSIVSVHKPEIPLHRSYTLSFDVSKFSQEEKEKMYIAQVVKNKYFNYSNTLKNDSIFKTTTKNLGDFKLHKDTSPPEIYNCSFYENQNLSNYRFFTIQIKDKLTGIKKYRGEIDNKWIRMELNVKTNTLTYDFQDKKLSKGKHIFTLIAMDNVGNTCTFTSEFQIK